MFNDVTGPGLEPGNTLDVAWNPRNKYLADHIFLMDSLCGINRGERRGCIPEDDSDHDFLAVLVQTPWWDNANFQNAAAQHFAVAQINSKDWPITEQDIAHANANQEFLACDVPGIAGRPTVTHASGTFSISWSNSSGCAPITSTYKFCFSVRLEGDDTLKEHCEEYPRITQRQTRERRNSVTPPDSWVGIKLVSAAIIPGSRIYPLWVFNYPLIQYNDAPWLYRGAYGGN